MFDDAPQIPLPPAGDRPRIQRMLRLGLLPLLLVPALLGAVGVFGGRDDAVGVRAVPGTPSTTPVARPVSLVTAAPAPAPTTATTAPPTTTTTAAPTTTTTAAPTTTTAAAPPTTEAAPVAALVAPPTTAPAPPPTTAAPKPPTTTTPPKPVRTDSGQATWYRWRAGNCAHNTLPRGTVVTVTATASGRSTTCVVGDRGAFTRPTIIDLDATVFERIAPLGAGRIQVAISW